jgi:hypothetical protein
VLDWVYLISNQGSPLPPPLPVLAALVLDAVTLVALDAATLLALVALVETAEPLADVPPPPVVEPASLDDASLEEASPDVLADAVAPPDPLGPVAPPALEVPSPRLLPAAQAARIDATLRKWARVTVSFYVRVRARLPGAISCTTPWSWTAPMRRRHCPSFAGPSPR